MSTEKLVYEISVTGNATEAMDGLKDKTKQLSAAVSQAWESTQKLWQSFKDAKRKVLDVYNEIKPFTDAYKAQAAAETRLTQAMRNTMKATDAQIQSIINLTAAQQQLGIVGDETQLSGAQELATYLKQTESLEKLIPVMNDVIAQQMEYGNTQTDAVTIASMLGKVMDGQTGALSRYGYTFTEAQEKILKFGTEQERVAVLSEVITSSVGGMNEALAQTPEGKIHQLKMRFGDLQETIGAAIMNLADAFAPILNAVLNGLAKLAPLLMNIGNRTKAIFAFVVRYKEIILGVAAAVGVLTLAIMKQTIATKLSAIAAGIVKTATVLWAAAQLALNTILSLNPIGLIIAGIAALVGVIIWVKNHTSGWGTLWQAVLNAMKAGIATYVSAVKAYLGTFVNSFMIAFDKIKLGWYKFKNALNIGDKEENKKNIAQLNKDVEEREKAIIDGYKQVSNNAKNLKNSFADVDIKWNKKGSLNDAIGGMKNKLGINAQLQNNVSLNGNARQLETANVGKSNEAIATGGTRSTNVNISLKSLIEKVVFEGSLEDNAQNMEQQLAESLLRVLNMASVSM